MDFYALMFVGNPGYSYEYDDIFVFQCELISNTEHDKRKHEMSHFSFLGKVKLPRDSANVSPYSFLGKVKLPRDFAKVPYSFLGKVKLPRDFAKVPYSFLGKVKLPRDFAKVSLG
jgi:hypothetical protein